MSKNEYRMKQREYLSSIIHKIKNENDYDYNYNNSVGLNLKKNKEKKLGKSKI